MIEIHDLAPDLILYNGNIQSLDAGNSQVQAIGIKDGIFVARGNNETVQRLAGSATKQINLDGRTAIPGIFDSHAHLLQVGFKLASVRLDECQSPAEMAALVAERAKETEPGTWIVGMGWNEANFTEERLPTRHDIDGATDQHPVLLQRFFNADVANSMALKLAGITRHTPDPESGKIEHDADGEPSGLIRASAKKLVRDLIPQYRFSPQIISRRSATRRWGRYVKLRPLPRQRGQSLPCGQGSEIQRSEATLRDGISGQR